MYRNESKHRRLANRDVKKRFQQHHASIVSTTASVDASSNNKSPAARLSSSEDRGAEALLLCSPPPAKKRIMTMSQLRHAAIHSTCVTSPLRRLAVSSPLAQRIRAEILKSDEPHKTIKTRASNVRGSSSPLVHAHPKMTPPPSSSSRRQRLQETRFRRHSTTGSTTSKMEVGVSAFLSTQFCHSHNTPLARYTSNVFSPSTPVSLQRHMGHNTKTPLSARSLVGIGNSTRKTPPRSSTLTSRTPSHSRRCISSRSPLQSLLAAAASSTNNSLPSPQVMGSSPMSTTSVSSSLTATNNTPESVKSVAFNDPVKPAGDHQDAHVDDDTSTTRRNLDKRSARLLHRHSFVPEIARLLDEVEESTIIASGHNSSINHDKNVTVVIRKRPMFPAEKSRGDFDVVSMQATTCTVFKTSVQADMKTPVIVPITYPCSATLKEPVTNPQVYQTILQPLVKQCQSSCAKPATLLAFGSTGSGKSYTMMGLEEELVHDLQYPISVQCLEVSGKICRDLLVADSTSASVSNAETSTTTLRSPIRILDQGKISVMGATWVTVESPKTLLQVLTNAKSRRATHATDRNHESSRSHLVVTLRLDTNGDTCLMLVDCAGTERSHDSLYHTKDRRVESAEINASLYALKECIRARAAASTSLQTKSLVIPYRSSTLTRILRPHLESGGPLAVIATVAPNATDTEHTLHTLETVSTLLGSSGHAGSPHNLPQVRGCLKSTETSPSLLVAPKKWNHQQLVNFLQSKHLLGSSSRAARRTTSPKASVAVPTTMDGRLIMRMNKIQIANALHVPKDRADKVFDLLRAETTRIARLELKRRVQTTKGVESVL